MFANSTVPATPPEHALLQALDGLANVDPDSLSDAALADAVVVLHRAQSRLAAATVRLTAALDARQVWAGDGSRNAAAWVAHYCRVPAADARAEVRLGRRLRAMPATSDAFGTGDIGPRHATLLASLACGRTAADFPASEALLVDQARTLEWPDLARAAAYWRQLADPDGAEENAARDHDLRRLHLSSGLDGTGILDGLLTPLARATVGGALTRIERELFDADWAAARDRHGETATIGHITRTPAQRRHDALVELAVRATTAPKHGKRPQPLISILVGYETFAGRICELADHTVLAPGTVAGLLGHALIERVVFDGPSRVLDLGRARNFSGAVRRALDVQDRHCTHTGCFVPADRCEGDHITPWAAGGRTTLDNGQLRCGFHNRWRYAHPEPVHDDATDGHALRRDEPP